LGFLFPGTCSKIKYFIDQGSRHFFRATEKRAYKVGVQTHKIEGDAIVIAAMQLSGYDIKTQINLQ
jgi:hypothetical protein